MKKFYFIVFVFLLFGALSFYETEIKKQIRIIQLDTKGEKSINILRKGENSILLHSGFVNLKKGESIGKHNSKGYEELIVVLKGQGVFEVEGKEPLYFKENEAIYCPPYSEHNVKNIGEEDLKYVYIVAQTE